MPNIWNETNPPLKPIDKKVSRFMQSIVGNKFDFIESDVAKQMSLYRFLLEHRNTPLEELYKSVKNANGKPMFSINELRNIKNYVEKHKFNSFSQRLQATQQGGDGKEKTYVDPRKNKFFDKLIMKGLSSITGVFDKIIPPCIGIPQKWKDTFFKILFFLHTMENNKLLGPIVSTGLDAIVLSLPVIINLVDEGAGKLLGLLPIPYASTAGDLIAHACVILVILFAVMLNVSRKHFGEGFKVFLLVVPIFGDEIMTGAEQFEKGAESYLAKRERIVDAVHEISPTAAGIVEYWAPDVSTKPKPEPTYNIMAIKDDVVVYAKDAIQDTIGIDISTIKLDKIPSMGDMKDKLQNTLTSGAENGDPESPENTEKAKKTNADNANAEKENADNANAEKENADNNANAEKENKENNTNANSEKPNKVKKLKRGNGSRNVTKNAKNGGARRRTHKNQRRK